MRTPGLEIVRDVLLPSTPVVLVAQPVPAASNLLAIKETEFFLFLWDPCRLRIVMSTVNLIDYDWRDIRINSSWAARKLVERPQNGHTALIKAVREVSDLGNSTKVAVEFRGSSIGAYSTQWLNEVYTSAMGESLKKWLDDPKLRRTKLPWPNIRILFPKAG
ncbi:hypothetical protein OF83DRAFT_1176266 [Amylostereum chailletii]|nr:hypothetical protein OF83DRAFT_1176266 [Amylostereum chailletii]